MSASFEQLIIVGNVGNDPELTYTPAGVPMCKFSVAVNKVTGRGDERKQKTKWFRVTTWRDEAERCNQYVKKGSSVLVVGVVEASAYRDRDDNPAASLNVDALSVRFMGGKEDGVAAAVAQNGASISSEIDIPF